MYNAREEEPTLAVKIVGSVIIVVMALTFLGSLAYGASWFGSYLRQQTQAKKQECLDRGGKITEYHGGFTSWSCDRMTQIR